MGKLPKIMHNRLMVVMCSFLSATRFLGVHSICIYCLMWEDKKHTYAKHTIFTEPTTKLLVKY